MTFWKPGAPAPPLIDSAEFDCDSERHRALPIFNPRGGLPLQQQREQLPIHRHRLALLHAVETHRVTILCGPTGCGKSTQLPQYLDEAGWTADGYVVGVTMPRRIAAVTVAGRVAQEMNVGLGSTVGYRIRMDSCVTAGKTRIEFMTEAILVREMLSDPLLTRFSVIIIDEAHERSPQTDLLLGLLKKILRKRSRLRLVVASATLEVESFVAFFQKQRCSDKATQLPQRKRPRCGWDDETGEFHRQREEESEWRQLCQGSEQGGKVGLPDHDVCALAIEGRMHPVKIHYLDEPAVDYVETAIGTVLAIHERQGEGDILVFLTGREEIDAACVMIRERANQAIERAPAPSRGPHKRPLHVVPLYSALPKEAQLKAFHAAPRGARKVVVSTNLAEASVTIDGIVFVVDAGFVKLDTFCPHNSSFYLNIVPCSRSAARQRAGRAGRTRPGQCYRLLTETSFRSALREHTLPEITRCDLRDTVLMLKCLGVDDVSAFEFATPPTRSALELALEDLYALGALDSEARLVEPLGLRIAHGPLPVPLMRLLLLAAESAHACAEEAASICAMLTVQSPWLPTKNRDRLNSCQQSFAVYEGDLVTLLNLLRQFEMYRVEDAEWAKRHLLNAHVLDRALLIRQQLVMYLRKYDLPIKSCGLDVEPLQRLACASLFLNAARRVPNGMYRLCRPINEELAPHVRFSLHPYSVLSSIQEHAAADFLVYVEAKCSGEFPELLQNTRVKAEWLPELAPHYFQELRAGSAASDI